MVFEMSKISKSLEVTKRLVTKRRILGTDNPDRDQAHRAKPVSTGRIIFARGPKFLQSLR